MALTAHTFSLDLNWKIIGLISKIDRFDVAWSAIEKRTTSVLRTIKTASVINSVAASVRLDGASVTDEEMAVILKRLPDEEPKERVLQEAAGYFAALNSVRRSSGEMAINDATVKYLHKVILQFGPQYNWLGGAYKQNSYFLESLRPDGSGEVIFRPTAQGAETEKAMTALFQWFHQDQETHPLIRCALFPYEFLSIQPFQDGNNALSRILAVLLLLKAEYGWLQYVSLEQAIGQHKNEYYKALLDCQRRRPRENVQPWLQFFLGCLGNMIDRLSFRLDNQAMEVKLPPRESAVYLFIEHHPGTRSGKIASKLDIPLPTVKRMLQEMVTSRMIIRHGNGPGTSYSV